MLFKFSSVCTFLRTTIQDDPQFRTIASGALSFVFSEATSSLKVFISSSVYVTIDPGPYSVVSSPFYSVGTLSCHFLGRVHKICLFSRCRERKRFFMPLQEFVVQFKQRRISGSLLKTLLFVFNSSKGDNGFENIVK